MHGLFKYIIDAAFFIYTRRGEEMKNAAKTAEVGGHAFNSR